MVEQELSVNPRVSFKANAAPIDGGLEKRKCFRGIRKHQPKISYKKSDLAFENANVFQYPQVYIDIYLHKSIV